VIVLYSKGWERREERLSDGRQLTREPVAGRYNLRTSRKPY
jgi:hypothetical protein